jgi:hypothetical protein
MGDKQRDGQAHKDTQTADDIISLFLYFQNKKRRLKVKGGS